MTPSDPLFRGVFYIFLILFGVFLVRRKGKAVQDFIGATMGKPGTPWNILTAMQRRTIHRIAPSVDEFMQQISQMLTRLGGIIAIVVGTVGLITLLVRVIPS